MELAGGGFAINSVILYRLLTCIALFQLYKHLCHAFINLLYHKTCIVSHAMCHVSSVTCYVSCVKCHKLDNLVELVGGGSVINRAYPVYF